MTTEPTNEFREPYIRSKFFEFATLVTNGQGPEALLKLDPNLYMQVSQAFSVAFIAGFTFGEHIGANETPEVRAEVIQSIQTEAKAISKQNREIAVVMGVRTRNTREMGIIRP